MRREDLMKADLLSEFILVASGLILFVPLILLLVDILHAAIAQF